MLKIINSLAPFFKDCYRRINVREYARIQGISPPSASKLLEDFRKEGLLKKEVQRQYFYYYANKDDSTFIDLSRIYWRLKLEKVGLLALFEKELLKPTIMLFGSLAKAEVKKDSDIDLAIITVTNKKMELTDFEKKLNRKIQIFIFKDRSAVKNEELLNNILNGYKLRGEW